MNTVLRSIPSRLGRITSSKMFVPEMDGLRFVAIASVFLFHLREYLVDKRGVAVAQTVDQLLARVLKTGSLGVPLFCVISGFALALPLASHYLEGHPRVPLRGYFLRRLTRIEPPYIINLLLVFTLLVIVNHQSAERLWPHLLASLGYVHHAIYGQPSVINIVAWTLEIEVQFYILAPFLAGVFAVKSVGLRRSLMVGACALIIAIRQAYPPPFACVMGVMEYFLTGFLLADVFITDWKRCPSRHWVWDVVAAGSWVAVVGLRVAGVAWAALLPIAIFLAYTGAFRGPLSNALFRKGWVVVIGGMCYTIYLYHSLFMSMIGRFLPLGASWSFTLSFLVAALLIAPTTLVGCALFFVWFEKPFMKRRPRPETNHAETSSGTMEAEKSCGFTAGSLMPADASGRQP